MFLFLFLWISANCWHFNGLIICWALKRAVSVSELFQVIHLMPDWNPFLRAIQYPIYWRKVCQGYRIMPRWSWCSIIVFFPWHSRFMLLRCWLERPRCLLRTWLAHSGTQLSRVCEAGLTASGWWSVDKCEGHYYSTSWLRFAIVSIFSCSSSRSPCFSGAQINIIPPFIVYLVCFATAATLGSRESEFCAFK